MIYSGQFGSPDRHFNKTVTAHKKEVNGANRLIFAQLGQLSVYGTLHDPTRQKYVGAEISLDTEGGQILSKERSDFFERIIDSDTDLYEKYARPGEPAHMSLAITRSYEDALDLADQLNEAGLIEGEWVYFNAAATLPVTYEL